MSLPPRTHELIRKYLDRAASPEEGAELEQLLRELPAAAEAFADASRMETWLAGHFRIEERIAAATVGIRALETARSSSQLPVAGCRTRQPATSNWQLATAIAAGVLLAVGAGLLIQRFVASKPQPGPEQLARPDPPEQPLPPEAAPGHHVLRGELMVNNAVADLVPDGAALRVAGERSAQIRLTDGSLATLEPSSQAVLHGSSAGARQVIELVEGSGTFKVEKGEGEFQVETRWGRVTALGTEFRVKVLPTNKGGERLAVVVLEGVVQVDFAGRTYVMVEGDDRVFQSGNESQRATRETRAILTGIEGERITLNVGSERPKLLTLPLLAKAVVTIDGKPARAADLTRGLLVFVQRLEGDDVVLAVRAEGPAIAGEVRAVDVQARTITLARKIPKDQKEPREGGRRDLTYRLAPEARISFNGQAVALGDLNPGSQVVLKLSVDQKTVIEIAQGKARRKEG